MFHSRKRSSGGVRRGDCPCATLAIQPVPACAGQGHNGLDTPNTSITHRT